ncbi:MAG: hypothetical protein E7A23_15520, partial [Enterobacter sp.]|nr:hypothetical protein [Enterobacter sp.]
ISSATPWRSRICTAPLRPKPGITAGAWRWWSQTDDLNSNLLYLALGIENGGPEASYSDVVQVEDGDAFLLCTDGFWHGVSEEQMKQSLHMVNTPQEWLTLMNQIIQKNGEQEGNAQDNYTALAVWMGNPQDTTLLHTLSDAAQFLPCGTD